MSERRLRVAYVIVQPVRVWDDGVELSPGPEVQPQAAPLSALASLAEQIVAQVSEVTADPEMPRS